ncbi:glycerol-3-phosphate acyltransferase PlsY [Elusimicrobium posterum]|uniref:glycerol-3-phosphate 1-O-acyltransferase PlsY n=1 Tax=Elusimicrobium posterum TaxID=3116653 RepID=UPI003C759DF8
MNTQWIVMAGLGVLSYLLGGIPTGYLVARKVKGIDIREYGSGNPGAANVYRIVGARSGWVTFIIDALKGFVCVRLALLIFPDNYFLAIACGTLAICGHMWTIYLKFRGGKGVATGAGVFAALLPIPTMIAFAIFAFFVWLSGHISVGSIMAAASMPVSAFLIGHQPLEVNIMVTVIAAVVVYKHVPNMKRLLQKKELAFEDGTKKDENRYKMDKKEEDKKEEK